MTRKCVRCTICEEVCPRDAIDRNVPAYEGTYKGPVAGAKDRQTAIKTKTTFTVDKEKCSLCGLCGALCPAIRVKHKEFTAEVGKVEGDVIWDETKCDACKVCVEACPEECITVEREVISDKVDGKVDIIQDNCCTCTWCSRNCPTEAITVEKLLKAISNSMPRNVPAAARPAQRSARQMQSICRQRKPAAEMKHDD